MNTTSSQPITISKSRLAELVSKMRQNNIIPKESPAALGVSTTDPIDTDIIPITQTSSSVKELIEEIKKIDGITDKYGNLITYNSKQQEFIDLASSGRSCVLIGAAGTGKTTCQKGVMQSLIQSGKAGLLIPEGHKHLIQNTPGIVVTAYTRRAVANIRRNMSEDMQGNCITIHKLLEYSPVYYEVQDPETGDTKTTMRFEPTRNSFKPLPQSIRTIVVEESSMVGTDLFKQLKDACPHNPQFIFLGDIQQLPPVFGPAVLGFKLLSLPVVELTEVYRQALESPIISLAHRILSAVPIPLSEFPDWKKENQLTLHPWKKKIDDLTALATARHFFCSAYDSHLYDPEEDAILIPFNKAFGTDELNKGIANHISKKAGNLVYQVVAGFNRYHFSIGDKILYDKEDAVITRIEANTTYTGAQPLRPSPTLDYWGHDPVPENQVSDFENDDVDVDFILSQVAKNESEDRVKQASHVIYLKMLDSDVEIKVDKASEINAMLLGYAITIHKSQGSEWRKVFMVLHQSHATMIQRELLYTAVTRAREELYVICEPETFVKGINSQRVKGNTLQEKAAHFKGKLDQGSDYSWLLES